MKKILIALFALVFVASPALGDEGPELDANHVNFQIRIISADPSLVPGDNGAIIKDNTSFAVTASSQATRNGWDFGDRIGYKCGYVEHFTNGVLNFKIHYQLVDPYPVVTGAAPQVTDLNGHEHQATALCGDSGIPNVGGGVSFDGTDHHPHGTSLVFYRDQNSDGRIDAIPADEFARVDYPTQCGTHYWVPGDQPGEAWLWIDPDGATETEPGLADCPGGAGEPYAAARAHVKNVAAGIAYCVTDRMDGDICTGLTPPPTPVQLGAGRSVLTCPDSSTPAVESTEPLIVVCA